MATISKKKITELDEITTLANDDVLPIVDVDDTTQASSGTTKKVTKEDLLEETVKTSSVTTSISSTPDNDHIPTEKAVSDKIVSSGGGTVQTYGTATADKLVKFHDDSGNYIEDGYEVVTTVGATGVDTAIPTEKAVRDAVNGFSIDTTNFDNNLSSADDTVQKAFDTLDDKDFVLDTELIGTNIGLDTTNFNNNLDSTEDTVQKALDKLDDYTLNSDDISTSNTMGGTSASDSLVPSQKAVYDYTKDIGKTTWIYCGTAGSTMSYGTGYQVAFDTAKRDDLSIADLTNHQIVVSQDGYYLLAGSIYMSGLAANDKILVTIRVNGTGYTQNTNRTSSADNYYACASQAIIAYLESGQNIMMYVYVYGGGGSPAWRVSDSASFLRVSLVSPKQ